MKIWLCDLTHDQLTIASDTIPTSIGYLASFLLADTEKKHEIRLFKYPGKLSEALEAEGIPDIIGFSHFMWNARLAYAFAEEIKKRDDKVVTVFGGLEYPIEPKSAQNWLATHPAVDFYIIKEAEIPLKNLVEALDNTERDIEAVKALELPGIHHLDKNGNFHMPPPGPRIKELTQIPSPYVTGLLDEFFDGTLMPVLTTNRGCPFSCTFCAEGQKYYNVVHKKELDHIVEELEYIANKASKLPSDAARRDLYISDSNFGMYKRDVELAQVIQGVRKKYGWPEFIQATTGKNQPERVLEVARILEGSMRLAGTVQSLDPEVLVNVKRKNIKDDALVDVAYQGALIGANSYSDVIFGLPGDSLDAHKRTVNALLDAGFNYLALYQLRLQTDAEMGKSEYRQKFGMKGKFRVLQRSGGRYPMFDIFRNIVEVEEVCVGGINFSHDDYIEARVFDLIVTIFYYDRMFDGILQMLDRFEIPRSKWIAEIINFLPEFPGITSVLQGFRNEAKGETFDSEDEMLEFAETDENIQRYLDGELGANLVGKYRILSITEHTSEIFSIGGQAALGLLKSAGIKDYSTLEPCYRTLYI